MPKSRNRKPSKRKPSGWAKNNEKRRIRNIERTQSELDKLIKES